MFKELLAAEFAPYGCLSELQLDQLERHYELLTRWNQRLNLTRIRDELEAVQLHYCESLFLGNYLPPGSQRIVDIGSGGGFPGLPIAIFRPDCKVTLVEAHQRKAVFLKEASRELPNVHVRSSRAEDLDGAFDWLVARAVAPPDILKLDLAPNIGLLVGVDDAEQTQGIVRTIPWGNRRVLFHVKRSS